MGRRNWIAGMALCAGLGWTAVAAQTTQPTVRVVLLDDVGVRADVLERAKRDATAIYDRAKITLEWVAADSVASRSAIVRIIAKPIGLRSRNRAVVGIAPGSRQKRGTLAYVFYERIQAFSEGLGIDIALMLGYAVAHELGHLLLPYDGHSVSGVMRGAWDRAQARAAIAGTLTFNPDQARLMRQRLEASASPTARAR